MDDGSVLDKANVAFDPSLPCSDRVIVTKEVIADGVNMLEVMIETGMETVELARDVETIVACNKDAETSLDGDSADEVLLTGGGSGGGCEGSVGSVGGAGAVGAGRGRTSPMIGFA